MQGSVSLSVFKGMLKSEVLYPAANADGTAPAYGGITRTKRYYYDYRGQVVQMAEYDSDGWSARYSTKYDFCGDVLATKETHTSPLNETHCLWTWNESDTYGYAYDGMNRLTDAAYYAGVASTQGLLKTEKNITYDRNGNITGLDRYGAAGLSEMLSFTHAGNQLADSRQGLQMEYNLLNLPREARHMNDTVSYRYLADGTKLSALTNVGDGLKYRGSLNLLDFGARYYDPYSCRWISVDSMAGKYYSFPWTNYPSAADNKARDTINSFFKRRGWKQPSFSIYYSKNKQYFPY